MTYGLSSFTGALVCKFLIKELNDFLIIFLIGTGCATISLIFTILLPGGVFKYIKEDQIRKQDRLIITK